VRYGGRVGSIGARNDFNLHTLAPEFELLDGGSTKSVARREQGGLAIGLDQPG
jgi:hypothetical protein